MFPWLVQVQLNDSEGEIMKNTALKILLPLIVVVVWLFTWNSTISIGAYEWICLGGNKSVIKFNGRNIVGPGEIELNVSSNIVYGMVAKEDDFIGRWFAICVAQNKVYIGEYADQVKHMLVQDCVVSNDFNFGCIYHTFLSFRKTQGN